MVSPLRTASPAALAIDSTRTHHCRLSRGSIGSPLRSECPTLCRYGRFSATTRPWAASASRTATRASKRSIPSNWVPVSAIRPAASIIVGIGRLCRSPISKSLGSWAGVTLTAPVPNSGSTWVSATIRICRSVNGCARVAPTRWRYLSSSGCTAIAVSPSIVSIRVVATTMCGSSSFIEPYRNDTSSPSTSA